LIVSIACNAANVQIPEAFWGARRYQISSHMCEDGPDSPLRHSVQLVNLRRGEGLVDVLVGEQVEEGGCAELARRVRVKPAEVRDSRIGLREAVPPRREARDGGGGVGSQH